MKCIRVGSGAGYGGDRLEPALELLEQGNLDFICFECLAERTIALAQKERAQDPEKGYNPLLEYRMEKVIPLAWKQNVKIVTNMGAANPIAAAKVCAEIARKNDIQRIKIAAVTGDDVLPLLDKYQETELWETHSPLKDLDGEILSANVYMGMSGILKALDMDADIVITGRVSDPAIFMAPIIHSFGWELNDWDKLAKATQIGHLLECGGQVCGGYFADPGKKDVPGLERLGFPIAEVYEDGIFYITKTENSGGMVTCETCIEQQLYEIHDPKRYLTPDVIADFSNVVFEQVGRDRVRVTGAIGYEKPSTWKTSIGYKDCWIGEGSISYAGKNCLARAKLAGEIVLKRLEMRKIPIMELKVDLIGVNSMDWSTEAELSYEPSEVRLRVAGRTKDKTSAERIGEEVESLYTNGPAGGGGAVKSVSEIVSVASMVINSSDVEPEVTMVEV